MTRRASHERMPEDADDRRAHLNQRLRQAFIEGAEEDSRRRLGRGLTAEELVRTLRRYLGDIGIADDLISGAEARAGCPCPRG